VISITTAAGTAASASVFKPLPKLTGLSQPNGPIGTVLTLTGTNLLGATALKIGSVAVTSFSVDGATQITATIPDTAVTGAFSVTTPAGAGNSPTSFGVLARIDTMSPTEATTGTTVTFTGQTFAGVTAVKFNGVSSGSITRVSATVLKAVVPSGATTGTVTVTNAGGVATGPVFTVDPKIAGFSPTSAVAGTTVTISGSGLAGATDVSFNGVAASIVLNTATQVKALVPSTATTGTISVTTPSGTTASTAIFKPLPKITGFSPLSGPRGTPGVVLTGTNLSGATAVKIGTIAVTSFTVDSALQITLTIPATAVTARFTVTTPAGTGTSATAFTVTASTLKARRSSRHR
jgi:hypothetical protein